jgi:organic radical activating enzyme
MGIEKWVQRCNILSKKVVREEDGERKYLMANFSKTLQKKDIEVHTSTMGNDFYRTKDNLKVDANNPKALAKAVKDQFDISDWASKKLNLSLGDCNLAFMPQLKSCNIWCPWCFVDDVSKNGEKGNGEFFSIPEIVDAFQKVRKEEGKPLHVIRLSGGEPTLAPWQWIELLEELEKRGLEKEIYFQGETNLTTGSFIEDLQRNGRLDKDFFQKVAKYNNFGVLCSFKGTDTESNLRTMGIKNKSYSFLEEERWKTFRAMVSAGIDVYPFVYDPNPKTLESFLIKGMEEYGSDFVSKTWILPLKLYGPEKERLAKRKINPVEYQRELDENFARSVEIMQELVPELAGHEYKEIPRTGIELKVQK